MTGPLWAIPAVPKPGKAAAVRLSKHPSVRQQVCNVRLLVLQAITQVDVFAMEINTWNTSIRFLAFLREMKKKVLAFNYEALT